MLEPGDGIDCLVCSGKYKGDFTAELERAKRRQV